MAGGNETEITLLVARARAGDRQAFDLLLAPHFAPLLLKARKKVGNDDDAYEVVQQTFIGVWEYLPTLDEAKAFPAVVLRIFRRRLADFFREKAGKDQVETKVSTGKRKAAPSQAPTAEESMAEADRARWTWNQVDSMDEMMRKVAHLHWEEDKGARDIAEELGIPEEKVAYLIRRVRDLIVAARKKEQVS